jgi:hypothetical protein
MPVNGLVREEKIEEKALRKAQIASSLASLLILRTVLLISLNVRPVTFLCIFKIRYELILSDALLGKLFHFAIGSYSPQCLLDIIDAEIYYRSRVSQSSAEEAVEAEHVKQRLFGHWERRRDSPWY